MFKPTYKLNVVNPEKNIVSLQPTFETWFKYAIAPNLLLGLGFVSMWGYGEYLERRDAKLVKQANKKSKK